MSAVPAAILLAGPVCAALLAERIASVAAIARARSELAWRAPNSSISNFLKLRLRTRFRRAPSAMRGSGR